MRPAIAAPSKRQPIRESEIREPSARHTEAQMRPAVTSAETIGTLFLPLGPGRGSLKAMKSAVTPIPMPAAPATTTEISPRALDQVGVVFISCDIAHPFPWGLQFDWPARLILCMDQLRNRGKIGGTDVTQRHYGRLAATLACVPGPAPPPEALSQCCGTRSFPS
jgi:hypothetical protein